MTDKKKKKERPDQVVFNDETQKYDAALKPYGTNVGAPSIKTTEINNWKNIGINKVNHNLKQKFDELQTEYQRLMEEFQWNELIYSTEYNFEPQIGETYYLYRRENETTFLSIIPPESFKMEFIGAFKLNSDKIWKKIETPE